MRVSSVRGLVLSAVCLVGLAACETTQETTGSIAGSPNETPASTGLMGDDP